MSAAIRSYTQMLPAYLVFFHEQDELNGDRHSLIRKLTSQWQYSALALSLKYQLERDELLDKKLQNQDLFCDDAEKLLAEFREAITLDAARD